MAETKESKKWYQSLTLWANLLALIGLGLQVYSGAEPIDSEIQLGIVAFVNLVLRLKTGRPIKLGGLTE